MEGIHRSTTKKIKIKIPKAKNKKQNPYMTVFLYGVCQTLNNLVFIPTEPTFLFPEDFRSSITFCLKFKNIPTCNLPKKFKFKHFMPKLFRQIRGKLNISETDFLQSFQRNPNIIDCKNMNCYVSFNKLCVFKVLSTDSAMSIINILPSYYEYMCETNFKSYLPQYLGLFKVCFEGKTKFVVVIRNIFSSLKNVTKLQKLSTSIKEKDDIFTKGGSLSDSPQSLQKAQKPLSLNIDQDQKNFFIETANSDARFLIKNNIMGWSILFGEAYDGPQTQKLMETNNNIVASKGVENRKISQVVNILDPSTDEQVFINIYENEFLVFNSSINEHCFFFIGILDFSGYCTRIKKQFSGKNKVRQVRNNSMTAEGLIKKENDLKKPSEKLLSILDGIFQDIIVSLPQDILTPRRSYSINPETFKIKNNPKSSDCISD